MELAQYLDSWQPEEITDHDELSPAPMAALSAVLDQPVTATVGDELPPLWHWLYFLDWPAQQTLGADGHPLDGHFLPPLPDRRRMIAGGRLEIQSPLRLGVPATRTSALEQVSIKQGRTGEMVFVTVRSTISQSSRICFVEEQDFVYRSGEDERRKRLLEINTGQPPTSAAPWQLGLRPDPTLLFRFSALTANAHRIHYDTPYVREVEGYPDLVVHGPLLALLMLELIRRNAPGRQLRTASYRLRSPVFAGEHVLALGDPSQEGQAALRIATARDQQHVIMDVTLLDEDY